jgi:hypothetical protein
MTVKEFVRRDADGDRIYTLEIVDVEEAPVSSGLPRSSVSHVHDESAHWRPARFAQMVQIVKGGLSPDDAALSRSASQTDTDIRFSRSAAPTGGTSSTPATPSQMATPVAPLIREPMERVVDTLNYNFQEKPLKNRARFQHRDCESKRATGSNRE